MYDTTGMWTVGKHTDKSSGVGQTNALEEKQRVGEGNLGIERNFKRHSNRLQCMDLIPILISINCHFFKKNRR